MKRTISINFTGLKGQPVRFMASTMLGASLFLVSCAGSYTVTTPMRSGEVRVSLADFEAQSGETQSITLHVDGYPASILLLKNGDGVYSALSSYCTHQGCQVRAGKNALGCPCHGSVFDREGKVLRGPAMQQLDGFPVIVSDDSLRIVILQSGEPVQGESK